MPDSHYLNTSIVKPSKIETVLRIDTPRNHAGVSAAEICDPAMLKRPLTTTRNKEQNVLALQSWLNSKFQVQSSIAYRPLETQVPEPSNLHKRPNPLRPFYQRYARACRPVSNENVRSTFATTTNSQTMPSLRVLQREPTSVKMSSEMF